METLEYQIHFYQTIFSCCLLLCFLLLILDIFLFRKYRIDKVFLYLTGKTRHASVHFSITKEIIFIHTEEQI